MKRWLAPGLLLLACAGTEPRPQRFVLPPGLVAVPVEGPPAPVAVALATPGPEVALTPPGEVDGQLFITAEEAWKLLAVDVQSGPTALRVPPALRRSGVYMWSVYRLCVTAAGVPSSVTMLKSADKLVDQDWRAAIRRWRFTPLRRAAATPFCSDLPVGLRVL